MDPDEREPTDEELAAIEAEQAGYCPYSEPLEPSDLPY